MDKGIIFGIRPEDIHNPKFAPQDIVPDLVEANIEVTELMGNETFVYLSSGGCECVARVDPRSKYSPGDKVQVCFNMANMHIFDRDSELAIR